MIWLIWLIIAALLAIGEVMTTGLFLATAAVAAVLTAALSIVLPGALQIAAFAVLALLGIGAVRPLAIHGLGLDTYLGHTSPLLKPHIVGRQAVVTADVTATGGQIRFGQGEFWTARPFEPGQTIPAGQTVEVMLVEGVTALVAPPPENILSDDDLRVPE